VDDPQRLVWSNGIDRITTLWRLEMAVQNKKRKRDIEKNYSVKETIKKLRRLADCLEQGKRFQMQVAGERISMPATAIISVEHERNASSEEVEIQLKWLLEKI
jgi:amphi-Trp domain-containing protein